MEKVNLSQRAVHVRQSFFTRGSLRKGVVFCAQQAGAALLGGLLAPSLFAGGAFTAAAPFAIALAAACGVRYLGMAVLGIAVGSLAALPYPANVSVMAMSAFAGLFNLAFRRFGFRQDIAAPLCACVCSAASSVIAVLVGPPLGAMDWVFVVCGAALAGCCSYFFLLCGGIIRSEGRWRIHRRESAALLLCGGMVLTSLAALHWGLFRPAHSIAVLFVLAAAYCWQEAGGAIAGACAGAAFALTGDSPGLAAVYAVGGLMAGVFSNISMEHAGAAKRSRGAAAGQNALQTVPLAGGFALACVFYVALHGASDQDPAAAVVFALEGLCAILIFVCVPVRLWNRLRAALVLPGEAALRPPESEAALQLTQTAGALRKVGEYVSEVAQGLEQLQASTEQSVYAGAEEALCSLCPEYAYCHEDHGQGMSDFYARITKFLRKGGELSLERLAQLRRDCGLGQPCRSPEQLRETLLRSYDMYAARKSCEQTEGSLRRAAAAQFDALSDLMEEVGARLTRQKAVEAEAAEAAQRVLEDHGFAARAVTCVRDTAADNAAQLKAAVRPAQEHSSLEALTKALSRATGIRFALPETIPLPTEDGALLTFAQQPLYQLQTGAVQMSSSRSEYCGDYFDCFGDGRGREVLVISDGMGTGGRAAVDSALATEIFSVLCRCGLSFAGAVGIVNQALLLKSCEETLATIDAAGVNLYTGEVEFCKAGGAASYLRRRSSASRVELSALPAGILRNIHPAQYHALLDAGDILVLVSDGVLCGHEDWLCAEIEGWQGSMQALAEHLASLAVCRREASEREDDLTVICAQLEARR